MFNKNIMKGTFNEPEWQWLVYMVQVEDPSTPECQQSVTSHSRCSVRGMHWTMNKTMKHEPWTINQGLTLSTIRSSFYFLLNHITAILASIQCWAQLCQPVYDNRCRPFVSPVSPASPRPSDLHTTELSRAPAAHHQQDPVSVCFLWRLTTLFWQKGLDFL